MKLIHLGDLHIDKKVFGYSLIEEQKDVLGQVLDLAAKENVDGVIIAGDVYDTAVPNVEAVGVLDWFLTSLKHMGILVYMISGNHDSAGRLNFGSALFDPAGIHIAARFNGTIPHYDWSDGKDSVRIHLLPFIKPGIVRAVMKTECKDWTDAVQMALEQAELSEDGMNILVSHQYYDGGRPSESEQKVIGNIDQVDLSVLEPFDYAALGHLHNSQWVGKPQYRYPGTLLKFSASELDVQKTVTLLELSKGRVSVSEYPIYPVRDFVRISGTYEQLMSKAFSDLQNHDNYFYIELLDSIEQPGVFEKLQTRYERILKIEYPNRPVFRPASDDQAAARKMKTAAEIISEFYELQNGTALAEDMKSTLQELWEEIHEAS